LEGVAQRITCPVLVCQAASEHFNPGQAEKLAAASGDRATVRSFTAAESAGYHSHIQCIRAHERCRNGWIAQVLTSPQANDRRSENRRRKPEAEDVLR
jgi:hypothetical protein